MTDASPRYPSPRKRFGQHFLERPWVEKVIRAIDPHPDDTFLEIGPGRGALTLALAARARHVVAWEIDRDLAAALLRNAPPNLTVVEGDFLGASADAVMRAVPWGAPDTPLRVAGNLPYNVASPILFKLVALYRAAVPLADATVMLQREVADRLTASPGSRDYGVPTVLIGQAADIRPVLSLPPGAFRPAPKVRSMLVSLRFHPDNPAARDRRTFEQLTQAVFSRRRKTIANGLLAYLPEGAHIPALLAQARVDGGRRPETLSIPDLVRLADAVSLSRAVL
jgi:16S rRNA (adenine1518-N6/adenine1519-N6)-dimethyltransferase